MHYDITDNEHVKTVTSSNYNYIFNKKNGFFARWGATKEDDPEWAAIGPEILDIEITTKCAGIPNKQGKMQVCDFCYKSNTPEGKNMSFETFAKILDNVNGFRQLTTVAFGADSQAEANPDLWKMMEYCRKKGVIPNITVAHISDEVADKLVSNVGACAVSCYADRDKNICYDSIKKLTDRGLKQVNMHFMISSNSYDDAMAVIDDIKNDSRLEKLNAIVFLSLKQKGRGEKYKTLDYERFKKLVDKAMDRGISFGFDSCSCPKFLKCVKEHKKYEMFKTLAEPCESSIFSAYIDVDGKYYPCSFMEGVDGWEEGLDSVNGDFIKKVWWSQKVDEFREKLKSNLDENECRNCPCFKI